MIYRKFKIEKKYYKDLSLKDLKILKILEEVVKGASEVYKLQLKNGFYPKDITRQELEDSAKKDPQILSPYTIVVRKKGQLQAISYNDLYSKNLTRMADKITKAAKLCQNKSFKDYLFARARSLLDGSYQEADIVWLRVRNSKIDFSIAPHERYLDQVLFIKKAFQAHVGIIDNKKTTLAEKIKDTLYASAKISSEKFHSTNIPKKGVQIFCEETPVTSGYISDAFVTGQHFPSDLDVIHQYGSKIIIYYSPLRLKFDKLYYPIFQACFEKTFASKYSRQLLFEATTLCGLLAHLGRQLHQFEGARERLKELYPQIDAANGFASGIEHSKHLVVKGLLSQEQLEAIMIIHIVWMLADWILYKQHHIKESHIVGNSILLNSYLSHGALRESAGISWPNFSRIFFQIESMAYILVTILQKGSYKEAGQFIQQNADLRSFERLSKTLSKINTKV